MASEKEKICIFFSLCLMINYMKTITATNINCNGKPFHCVNSTHFMICVDLGGGVSTTVDDFLIQCPPTTACQANNYFECEYQTPTTLDLTIGQGDETTHFEYDERATSTWSKLTTEVPFFQQTTELHGQYSSTVSTIQTSTPSETQTQYANTIDDTTVVSTQVDDLLSTSVISLNHSDIFTYEVSEVEIITSPPSMKRPFNNDSLRSLKISNNEGLIADAVDLVPTKPGTIEYRTTTIYPSTESNNLITPSLFGNENITQNMTVREQGAVVDVTRRTHYDTTTVLNLNDILSTTFKYDESMPDNYNFSTDSNLMSSVTVPDFVPEIDDNRKVKTETTEIVSSGIDTNTTESLQYQISTESTSFNNGYSDSVTIYDWNLNKAVTDHTDKIFVTSTNTILETDKLHTSQDLIIDTTLSNDGHIMNTEQSNTLMDSLLSSVLINTTELPSLVIKGAEATLVEVADTTVPTITEYISSITKNTEPPFNFERITGGSFVEDNHILNIERSNNYTSSNYTKEKNTNTSDFQLAKPPTGEVPSTNIVQEATTEVIRSTSAEPWKYQPFSETNAPINTYATEIRIQKDIAITISIKDTTNMPETEPAIIVNITEKVATENLRPELHLQDQATEGINFHDTSYVPSNDTSLINKTNAQSTLLETYGSFGTETELFTETATANSFTKRDFVTNFTLERTKKLISTENDTTVFSAPEYITTETSTQSKLNMNSSYALEIIVSTIFYNNDNSSVTETTGKKNEVATEPAIIQNEVTEVFPLKSSPELSLTKNDGLVSTYENTTTEISIQNKSIKNTDMPYNIPPVSQNSEYLNAINVITEIVQSTTVAGATQGNVIEASRLTFPNDMFSMREPITTGMSVQSNFSIDSTIKPEFIISTITNNEDYLNVTLPENASNIGVTQENVTETPATSTYYNIYQVTDQTVKSTTNGLNVSSYYVDEIPMTSLFETNQELHVEKNSLTVNNNESLHTQILNYTKDIDKDVLLKSQENLNISSRSSQVFNKYDVLDTTVTWDTTESTDTYITLNDIQIINDSMDINDTRLKYQSIIDSNISGDTVKSGPFLNSPQLIEIIPSTEQPFVTVLLQKNGTNSLYNVSSNITSDNVTNDPEFNATENANYNNNGLLRETPDSSNKIISFENQDHTEINLSRGIYYTLTEIYDSYTDSHIIHNDYENSFKESIAAIPIKTHQEKSIQDDYKNFAAVNDIHASSTTESTTIYSNTRILSDTPETDTINNVRYTTRAKEVESTHGINFNQGYEDVNDIYKTVNDKLLLDTVGNIKREIHAQKKNNRSSLIMTTFRSIIDNNQQKHNSESPHVIKQKSIVPAIFANDTDTSVNSTFQDFKIIGSIDKKHEIDFSNVFNSTESYTPTPSLYHFSDDLKKNMNQFETQDTLNLNYTNNKLYTRTVNQSNETNFGLIFQQKEMDISFVGDVATSPLNPIMDDELLTKSIKKTQNIVVDNVGNIVQGQYTAIKTNTSRDSYNENHKSFLNKVDGNLHDIVNHATIVSESKILNGTDGGNILNMMNNSTKVTTNIEDNRKFIISGSYLDFNTKLPSSTPFLGNTTLLTYKNTYINKGTNRSSLGISNKGNIYAGHNIDLTTNMISESGFNYKKDLANDTIHELKNIILGFNSSYYQEAAGVQQSDPDNVSPNVTSKLMYNNPPSSIKNEYYESITKSPSVDTTATLNNNNDFSKINERKINSKFIYNTVPETKRNSTTLNISQPSRTENTLKQNITDFDLKRKFVSTSLHTTDLTTKNATVNPALFTCQHRFRGRYADKNDCAKFYICIGRNQPLYGKCPVNTVFSEIKKQCTKNLSHCIRNNQFHCVKEGRFSDVLRSSIYYICVKNNNVYIRFQFQCQTGYSLNITSIRCAKDLNNHVSTTSNDSDSNRGSAQSTIEHNSKEKKGLKLSAESFVCSYEGKFPDNDDCRRYYVCSKNSKSVFRRKVKKCDSDEVFHKEKKKCVNDDSYEC